jgi:hypothetical protein
MPSYAGPGTQDLFDPHDLDDVRNRIVMPVITSLIRPEELERVEVGWGPFLQDTVQMTERAALASWRKDLWVLIAVAGKTLEWQLWQPDSTQNCRDDTVNRIAFAYALGVEQWVQECLGRHGEQVAKYVIPARDSRS